MNDSVARVFGNVLIAVALLLLVFGTRGVAPAVIGVGLLVGGCLLRIEAAIVRGKSPALDPPQRDPARAWRRQSEVLHLPEHPGNTRPWQEPED